MSQREETLIERRFIKLNSISPYLKCSICMEVLHHPVRVFCGHTFCLNCLNSCLQSNPNCPICRAPISHKQAGEDLLALSIINELEVFCIFVDCSWKGELQSLQIHLKFECLHNQQSANKSSNKPKKVQTGLQPAIDQEVQERINQNISKGSLISRALSNNQTLKTESGLEFARKMIKTQMNGNKKAHHADEIKDKYEMGKNQDKCLDFLMELYK